MTTAATQTVQVDEDVVREAIRIRHELHQIPELAFEERQTAQLIRGELRRLGIPFIDNIETAPTATVACIGDVSKPCVALRADIDALPITEKTGVAYVSRHPGRMHACGHDGHTAGLLGAAAVLKRIEKDLRVCVKLIFQPAEEGGGGAKKLCDAGVLDGRIGPKVQRIFGLHGRPEAMVGVITTRPGPLMAAVNDYSVTFRGRGSHGAYPHLGRDPIVAAAHAILALQQIVSREINPVEPAVVTIGMISAGTATNIIPETASLEGTARTVSNEMGEYVKNAIKRRLEGVAMTDDVKLEFTWHERYPVTMNHPEAVDYVREVVTSLFGPDAFLPAPHPTMGAEDFSYYLQRVPGCFSFVGTRPAGITQAEAPGLHSPLYNYNDDVLGTAIRLLVGLAVNHRAS